MRQQVPELDAKKISEILTGMKKQMSQVEGEMATMKNDAMSSLFQNVAGMMNQLFTEKTNLEHKLKEHEATLEQIYQGHPDIQIAIEKEAKDTKAKIDAKTPKITKGKK